MHVGLLDHRGERLLGGAARLQEGGEVTALAQAGDLEVDPTGAHVPGAFAVVVALHEAVGVALVVRCAVARLDLGRHQPLGGEGKHLSDKIGIGALLDHLDQRHSVVGHRHLRLMGSSSQLEP